LPYTPAQLEAQLKATAYPMAQGCSGSGAGIVDARTLLDTAGGAFKLLADGVAQATRRPRGRRAALRDGAQHQGQGLTFSSSGGSGNADLYVKFGSAPTTASYDCRSNNAGNGESCNIALAQPGTYYVLLQARRAFPASVSPAAPAATASRSPPSAWRQRPCANFTDVSSDADGGVTSRAGSSATTPASTLANPSHTYNLAGAYTCS
jgi:hypothetical protein